LLCVLNNPLVARSSCVKFTLNKLIRAAE